MISSRPAAPSSKRCRRWPHGPLRIRKMRRVGVQEASVTNERREKMATHEEENALERGLHVLEQINDPELADAYRQYMERIEALVGREHVDTYAAMYQRSKRNLSHQALGTPVSSEERA